MQGVELTVSLFLASIAFGFAVGLLFALGKIFGPKAVRLTLTAISDILRAIPPIVLIFIIFVLFVVDLPPFISVVVALGMISGAYQSEIFRGAIQAVSSGQVEAARSMGMSKIQAIGHVVLPQALRLSIPSWSNEAVSMIKETSLAYAIGIPELMRRAEYFSARTYNPLVAFSVAAVIYIILCYGTTKALKLVEQKTKIPGMGHEKASGGN